MNYFDYNKRYQYQARIKQKAKPKRIAGRKKASPGGGNYQLKFYAVIAMVLLSTFFYIRYQIIHEEDSVFSGFARMVVKQKEKYEQRKEERNQRRQKARLPERKAVKTEKQPVTESARASAKSQELMVYLPLNEDGRIRIVPVRTKVEYTENIYVPLIRELVKHDGSSKGLINSFPEGTSIKRAWTENNVLMLDFNNEFEYNKFGYRGLQVQIQQVLWTVFKLKSEDAHAVDSVSFLINGTRRRKIGGEGLELKVFYRREDLRRYITLKKSA